MRGNQNTIVLISYTIKKFNYNVMQCHFRIMSCYYAAYIKHVFGLYNLAYMFNNFKDNCIKNKTV
jgi:hypothetical protein